MTDPQKWKTDEEKRPKEEDEWCRKNNRTKEEKQEVRNKEAFTQKNEADATRQQRQKIERNTEIWLIITGKRK